MNSHLEDCADCRSTVAAFRALAGVIRSDAQAPVPAGTVARAEALFPPPPEGRDWIEKLKRLVAQPVFTANQDWLPAGVRSASTIEGSGVRQVSYRAGEYEVDLRLEAASAGRLEIAGQIARGSGRGYLEGVLIQVISRGKTVGETETNQFGEFLLERPREAAESLRILLRSAGHRIDVPLSGRVRRK